MPYATQPNVTLTTAWTPIAVGPSELYLQNLDTDDVIVSVGPATPTAGSVDGNVIRRGGVWSFAGGTTETIYARASSLSARVAVTKL